MIGKVLFNVASITLCITNFHCEKIIGIFHNKFKGINLCRLYHMQNFLCKSFKDQKKFNFKTSSFAWKKHLESIRTLESFITKYKARRSSTTPQFLICQLGKKYQTFMPFVHNSMAQSCSYPKSSSGRRGYSQSHLKSIPPSLSKNQLIPSYGSFHRNFKTGFAYQ